MLEVNLFIVLWQRIPIPPRDGKFLEILGNYDPKKNPAEIIVKEERVRDWLDKGAKATLTVANLLKTKGIEARIK